MLKCLHTLKDKSEIIIKKLDLSQLYLGMHSQDSPKIIPLFMIHKDDSMKALINDDLWRKTGLKDSYHKELDFSMIM